MIKTCKKHGKTHFTLVRTRNYYYCPKCRQEKRNEKKKQTKLDAISYKGGKCVRCGYSKCIAALEFHHRDPTKKEFGIASGHKTSWKSIKRELNKCDLLCSNCHREEHYME